MHGVRAPSVGCAPPTRPRPPRLAALIALATCVGPAGANPIVWPERKLFFCKIEKVGSQSFSQMFRELILLPMSAEERAGVEHVPYYNFNSPAVLQMGGAAVRAVLEDPLWHKAVFYREPLERFASAYASKCAGSHRDGSTMCERNFGVARPSFDEVAARSAAILPWRAAQEALALRRAAKREAQLRAQARPTNRRALMSDPLRNDHWRPQHEFCMSLARTLANYSTVEQLHPTRSHAAVLALLRAVGVPLDEGELAAPEREIGRAAAPGAQPTLSQLARKAVDRHFPPPQERSAQLQQVARKVARISRGRRKRAAPHDTAVSARLAQLYANASTLAAVLRVYAQDYEVFRVPLPAWAAARLGELCEIDREIAVRAARWPVEGGGADDGGDAAELARSRSPGDAPSAEVHGLARRRRLRVRRQRTRRALAGAGASLSPSASAAAAWPCGG